MREQGGAGGRRFNREIGIQMPGSRLPLRCCHLPSWPPTVNSTGVGEGGPSFSSSCPVLLKSSDGPREAGRVLIAQNVLEGPLCARPAADAGESVGGGGGGQSSLRTLLANGCGTDVNKIDTPCSMCGGDKGSGRNGRQGKG